MKTIITILILISTQAMADVPNAFNKNKTSTESLVVGVKACEINVVKSHPKMDSSMRMSYCACMMDAAMEMPYLDAMKNQGFCLQRANQLYGAK